MGLLNRSTSIRNNVLSKEDFQHFHSSKNCLAVLLKQCLLYFVNGMPSLQVLFSIYEHCYDGDIKRYLLPSNLSLAIKMSFKVYKVSGMNNLMKNSYILGYFSRKHQLFLKYHT